MIYIKCSTWNNTFNEKWTDNFFHSHNIEMPLSNFNNMYTENRCSQLCDFQKFFGSALVLEIVPGRICANFEYEIKWKKCSTWNSYTIEHTTMPFSSVLKIHLIVLLLTNLLKNRWPLIGEIIERRIVFSKRAFILSNKFSSDYLYILLCIVMFHVEQHSIEINISKFRLVPF